MVCSSPFNMPCSMFPNCWTKGAGGLAETTGFLRALYSSSHDLTSVTVAASIFRAKCILFNFQDIVSGSLVSKWIHVWNILFPMFSQWSMPKLLPFPSWSLKPSALSHLKFVFVTNLERCKPSIGGRVAHAETQALCTARAASGARGTSLISLLNLSRRAVFRSRAVCSGPRIPENRQVVSSTFAFKAFPYLLALFEYKHFHTGM